MKLNEVSVNNLIIPTFSFDPYYKDPNKKYLFFDIETLGFHRRLHPIVMIGLLIVEPGTTPIIKQWLLDSEEEEPALLQSFFSEIQAHSVLVSFNGKRFDWPFLVSRAKMHHILPPIIQKHLDLYDFYQGGFPLLFAENHTLRELVKPEFVFQSCPSKEIPALLQAHMHRGDKDAASLCFQHNKEDLLSLLHLEKKMLQLQEKWQIQTAEVLTLVKIQKSRDFYLVRYLPSNSTLARSLVKQGKNFSVDFHSHDETLEVRFRYLAIQEKDVIYHALPHPWYPFSFSSTWASHQSIQLPDGLSLLATDTELDRFGVHLFCGKIIDHIQKEHKQTEKKQSN